MAGVSYHPHRGTQPRVRSPEERVGAVAVSVVLLAPCRVRTQSGRSKWRACPPGDLLERRTRAEWDVLEPVKWHRCRLRPINHRELPYTHACVQNAEVDVIHWAGREADHTGFANSPRCRH